MSLQPSFDLKLVFFGGKGGVGKTTCASAYALKAAQCGKKTLLVSTDLAHSLSDLFGLPIGGRATELDSGLTGLEIDPDREAQVYLDRIRSGFSHRLDPEAARTFSRQLDLAAASPGSQEAALFDKITDLILQAGGAYDLVVFDTAPTGQTLRLLMLPEMMGSWIDSLTTQRSKVSAFFKMFTRVSGNPDMEDPILELLKKRRGKFSRCREVLTDPNQTGFYFVLIPEKLPILETQNAIPRLEKFGIPISGMIINRLLPSDADGEFLEKRREQEKSYLAEINSIFKKWPLSRLYQQESDIMTRE
ncbi:MAG TPA: TRC40/GET3/ArsA family transport-energizing ATPase, partial [Nitrospiria bacterium]